jgi:hypothetical protein
MPKFTVSYGCKEVEVADRPDPDGDIKLAMGHHSEPSRIVSAYLSLAEARRVRDALTRALGEQVKPESEPVNRRPDMHAAARTEAFSAAARMADDPAEAIALTEYILTGVRP